MEHDGNPKDVAGQNRPPLHLIPPSAMVEESKVAALGADKYGEYNWREKPVKASVYYSAAMRHLMAWWAGEDEDPESEASPLAHVRNCMAILLDAEDTGCLIDDRAAMKDGLFREILNDAADDIQHRRHKSHDRLHAGEHTVVYPELEEPEPRRFSWLRFGRKAGSEGAGNE